MPKKSENIVSAFWIAFIIAIVCFCLPFYEKKAGLSVYMNVFREVFKGNFYFEIIFILFLLICIALWLPIMAYAFYRYSPQKNYYTTNQHKINYSLFAMGFSVYALPIYIYCSDTHIFSMIAWGYWYLMLCMTVMFVCYLAVQEKQLMDNDNMSKHLINND